MNLDIDNRIIIGIFLGFANGLIFGAALHRWYADEAKKRVDWMNRCLGTGNLKSTGRD